MRPFATFLAAVILLAPLAPAGKSSGPADYEMEVLLAFRDVVGEEGIREELELQMITELRRAACFRAVELVDPEATGLETPPPEDRLRLSVTVRELFDETTYDTSIAQRTDPNAPPGMEIAHTSRFRVLAYAALEHPSSRRELRGKQFHSSGAHRPTTAFQDARLTARSEALVELVRTIRTYVCKGGQKRLAKELGG